MSDFKINKYLRKPNRRVSRTVTSDTTLQNGDSGGVVIIDSSSNDVTITIPSDTNESFADGTVIWLYRDGANFAILRGESGVTLNPDEGYIQSDKTEIYIRKQAANEWVVGDLGGYQSFITATGGTVSDITVNGVDYRVHEFTTVGTSTFEVTSGGEVEYLVVAGGGGGADTGGGGAGGYRSSVIGESSGGGASAEPTLPVVSGVTYTITVGAGGIGANDNSTSPGESGEDSVFGTIRSIGGGGGGSGFDAGSTAPSGGSGGGGGSNNPSDTQGFGGSGTPNQGFDGGDGTPGVDWEGGGGGGAGSVGQTASDSFGGDGGVGVISSIDGTSTERAGGGGGASRDNGGSAVAGGGNGGTGGQGASATANTGGGGGGCWDVSSGNGGSGIVIIRYRL